MNYKIARQTLIDENYIPIPITPNDKKPAIRSWTDDAYAPPTGFSNYGVGVACGKGEFPVAGVDLDILDETIAKKMSDYVFDYLGETIYRVGKAPKTMLLYLYSTTGIVKHTSKRYDIGRVEILGNGQQFVAFGTHPDTKQPYTWPGILGDILTTKAKDLPVIDNEAIINIIQHFETLAENAGYKPLSKTPDNVATVGDFDPTDPLDMKPPIGIDKSECEKIISNIDPDCSRDEWIRVGMALHHEYQGDNDGLILWDSWSAKGVKYNLGETTKQWESFGSYSGRPITAAYLLKIAKAEKQTDFFKTLKWSTSRFVNNPPEIPMVVHNFLPKGIVSLFYSAGGAGKSTLMLYMAVKIALAKDYDIDFLGNPVEGGKVVIVTAEDPELILNRRFMGIVNGIAQELNEDVDMLRAAIDRNLSIVSTFGHSIQLFRVKNDGCLLTTEYYDSLLSALSEIQELQLVIIDTKTRFSPGEGLGNVTATQEITHYENIAKQTSASVMLLHHSNKSSRDGSQTGQQAYRDATAIFDSVRAAWYLRSLRPDELTEQGFKEDETGYLLLENSKNNYIERSKDKILNRAGFSYTVHVAKPKVPKAQRAEADKSSAYDKIVGIFQTLKGAEHNQGDVCLACRERANLSRKLVVETIGYLIEDGLLEQKRKGQAIVLTLTDEGRNYNLSIEG